MAANKQHHLYHGGIDVAEYRLSKSSYFSSEACGCVPSSCRKRISALTTKETTTKVCTPWSDRRARTQSLEPLGDTNALMIHINARQKVSCDEKPENSNNNRESFDLCLIQQRPKMTNRLMIVHAKSFKLKSVLLWQARKMQGDILCMTGKGSLANWQNEDYCLEQLRKSCLRSILEQDDGEISLQLKLDLCRRTY
jgi:hypothetical protein